jgi:hypothetical protein
MTLLVLASRLPAQSSKGDGPLPISFHVTSVKRDVPPDWCTTGQCRATRFTVAGYSKVPGDAHFTEYVLTCIESQPADPDSKTAAASTACPRLRANANYDAKLFADVIDFIAKTPKPLDAPLVVLFDIQSQREVMTPR